MNWRDLLTLPSPVKNNNTTHRHIDTHKSHAIFLIDLPYSLFDSLPFSYPLSLLYVTIIAPPHGYLTLPWLSRLCLSLTVLSCPVLYRHVLSRSVL